MAAMEVSINCTLLEVMGVWGCSYGHVCQHEHKFVTQKFQNTNPDTQCMILSRKYTPYVLLRTASQQFKTFPRENNAQMLC